MATTFGTAQCAGGGDLDAFGTQYTVIVPTSINQAGTVEVTQLIQDVIDGALDGSRIMFQPNAIYWCEHPLELDGRQNILLLGRGATLKNTKPYPYDKVINNCTITEDPAFPRAGHPKYTRFALVHSTSGNIPSYATALAPELPVDTVTGASSGPFNNSVSTLVAPPGATGVENPIPLIAAPGITITFRPRANTQTRDNIHFDSCKKCKVIGFNIVGSNATTSEFVYASYVADLEGQHGIACIDSDDMEFAYNEIQHVYGDLINVQSSTNRGSNRVYIHDNDMHHNGRQGITPAESVDCVIKRNNLSYLRRSGIDIEVHAGGIARRITIEDNDFGPIWPGFNWVSIAPYGSGLMTVEDIIMHGNRLHCAGHINVNGLIGPTNATHPVGNRDVVKWWGPFTMTNNICDEDAPTSGGSTKYAFTIEAFHDVTIVGNFLKLQPGIGMRIVQVSECINVEVHDNDFRDGVGEATILAFGGTLGEASFAGGGDVEATGIQSTGGTLGSIHMLGGGTLGAVGKANAYGTIDVRGGGTLAGTGKENWHGSANFAGGGTLEGDGIVKGIGDFQGGGTLGGTGHEHTSAAFSGGGTLAGAGGVKGSGLFSGGGTLAGDGIVKGIGDFQGGGRLSGTGAEDASATFGGGGTLVAHGQEKSISVFAGGGALVAVGAASEPEAEPLAVDNSEWRVGSVSMRGPGWDEGGWEEDPWDGFG